VSQAIEVVTEPSREPRLDPIGRPVPLAELGLDRASVVTSVGGERGFRRRLMELGLVPGTAVRVTKVAPLGDPLELVVRGCSLSIRAAEARAVEVIPRDANADASSSDSPRA
jgi:ferrous iron transport protein A